MQFGDGHPENFLVIWPILNGMTLLRTLTISALGAMR